MKLRVNGVYRLPNERELVVTSKDWNDAVPIYTLESLDMDHSLRYSVGDDGRLSMSDKLTAWDVRDLQDTGRDVTKETA